MFSAIGKVIKWIGQHFLGMLFLLIVLLVFMPSSTTELKPANLQEIQLSGPIMDADMILKEIEEIQKDPKIKGVLLNVNSPGGAVPPSIEIAYAIKALKEHKPVVAYASGMMTSGSYYASIYANTIIANPGSIVGSIGVIMESANIKELMDTVGVKTQIVKEGTYKEAGTPTREWTAEERAELERLTKDTYELFIQDVADARGLDVKHAKAYADAHIFSAKRAKDVGLIDHVGVKIQAKAEVEKLANVTDPRWKEKDKLESFMEQFATKGMMQLQNYFYGLKASF
ncbi:signal peptide peptidase SppA [Sulfurovum sp. XGS-02]|uniref:signal peptide peptidase SppA n=1 Tax=Sulfurovum sp. XGS-02 TaxID=2925411 RepID=UPI00205FB58F|nr:signal peptide peptidase SppA [Sulfurovum sp. XGS-02]UPT78380.1 signal peptide peptidase SppA [Sulfurovum sp. XGS-02]